MDRKAPRALALALLVLTLFGLGAWDARAQVGASIAPVASKGLRRGRSAIQALGNYLPQVAAQHGQSAERLRNLLLRDPDLAVTEQGNLLYTCVFPPPAGLRAESLPDEAPVGPLATSFQLHSRPGSQRKIFLDFDGHTTTGTQWNSTYNGGLPIISLPFDTDGSPLTFSASELTAIQAAWLRVSEDYAPFDIDVTTEDPGLEAIRRSSLNDAAYGVRVVVSPGAAWYPAGGGVGFIGTFDAVFPGEDWPCFVFHDRLQSVPRYIGEAAAHEAGHTLGLNHDGTTNGVGYYEGQGDWAPIMGAAYYHNVTQWSKGEYSQANNQEDDLAVMVTNGAPLLADDHGNTIGAATTFDTNAGTATGLITTASDQDVFRLTVGAGTLRLRASTLALANGANVDLGLHLYDGQNNHLAGVNSDASIDATVTADVSAGTYYAVVSGTGSGTALTTGYSNYASLGNYTLALVEAPFTVTSPNGGENWATGSSHAITWTSTISGNVKLEYSTNSGSSWTQIVASTANDGTHTWSVPNNVTSQARVRVSSVLEPASNDASDGDFTIQTPQAGTIAVLAPNGGEVWTIGNAQSITWSSANVTGNVKLEYSTNGGANWTIIAASTANDGTESWMVPNAATIQGRVRVTSASETTVKDASDANFTIQAPPATVTVTAPNGGESWTAGTSQAITWSSANLSGSVKLEYSATGGAPWTTIAASTANDGSENWTVPNAPTTQARVRISAVDAPSVSDTSNANFTITAVPIPTLTLLAPNGGQSLVVGATQSITWSSANVSGNVKLELSIDGGANWSTIAASTANDGAEDWTIPNLLTVLARVRVSSVAEPGVNDASDANFSIVAVPVPTLTVTSPNGGETWVVGSLRTITWSSTAVTGSVMLEYSTNGGSSWITIAANTANDGSEAWTVPSAPSVQAQVRVTSLVNGAVSDASDTSFTIQAAPLASIIVTAPNGGETWDAGSSHAITWTSANVTGNVKLEYSPDAGATWIVIAASTANDQSENWVLPASGTVQARVRVSSVDGAVTDASDANFTVRYVGGQLAAPKKVNFGTLKLGKTKSMKVVLQNTAKTGNLEVNVSISGAPFRIVSGGGANTLLPKQKLTVVVIFEPGVVGTFNGVLTVTSSDPAKASVAMPLLGKVK